MAWIQFTAAFDWSPPGRKAVVVAYPAGLVERVTRDCAAAALAAGKAVRVRAPKTAAAAKALRAGSTAPERL